MVLDKMPYRIGLAGFVAGILVAMSVVCTVWFSRPREKVEAALSLPEIVQQHQPSIVSVFGKNTSAISFSWPQERYQRIGTGFFVTEDGWLITNRQIVTSGDLPYYVKLEDGQILEVQEKVLDPVSDLALLKVDWVTTALEVGEEMPAVGDAVVAFGNRWSGTSAAQGAAISANHRQAIVDYPESTVDSAGTTIYSDVSVPYHDVLITDRALGYGYAGGPLLNQEGEVMGVQFAQEEGEGFALPAYYLTDLLQRWRDGHRAAADVGLEFYLLGERMEPTSKTFVAGAHANQFCGNTPLPAVGILEHTKITKLGEYEVTYEQPLERILQHYRPGDAVQIESWSPSGEQGRAAVELVAKPLNNVSWGCPTPENAAYACLGG